MKVVDGIAPVILNVPAERREAHPHIKPGHLHARNISIDVSKDRLFQYGHIVEVPARKGIFLQETEKGFVKENARTQLIHPNIGKPSSHYTFSS